MHNDKHISSGPCDFATTFRTDKLRSVFFAVTFFIFHVVSRVKENRGMSPTGFSIFYVNNIVASSLLWASENIRVRRMDTFNLGF